MLAIIDADTLVYKAGFASQRINKETKELEVDPVEYALNNVKKSMFQILERTNCSDYKAYLTASKDKTCFRTQLYPEYKANRKDKEKPVYYDAIRKYLVDTGVYRRKRFDEYCNVSRPGKAPCRIPQSCCISSSLIRPGSRRIHIWIG